MTPSGRDELREQITKALVAGICTLWDDSQDAEEAWKVARAAMNDGWPVIEAEFQKRNEREGEARRLLAETIKWLQVVAPEQFAGLVQKAKDFLESKPLESTVEGEN